MERYKLIERLLPILIIIATLFNIYIWFFIPNHNKLKSMPYTQATFDGTFKIVYDLSMEEAIKIIDDFMGIHYTLNIVEKNEDYLGRNLSCSTYIEIVEQSGWSTLWTLTHELVHYKYQSSNEIFTNFRTWQLLYESNIDILVARAKYEAYEQCELGSFKDTNYDISWYVTKYLKGETNGFCH